MRFKLKNKKDWHSWFAWKPTRVGDELVWCEWIERRYIMMNLEGSKMWECRLSASLTGNHGHDQGRETIK